MAEQEDLRQAVPTFYASAFEVASTGRDLKIVLQDSVPGKNVKGEDSPRDYPVALISMSVHSAKDLHALLGDMLSQVERKFGSVSTPFLEKRAARKAD